MNKTRSRICQFCGNKIFLQDFKILSTKSYCKSNRQSSIHAISFFSISYYSNVILISKMLFEQRHLFYTFRHPCFNIQASRTPFLFKPLGTNKKSCHTFITHTHTDTHTHTHTQIQRERNKKDFKTPVINTVIGLIAYSNCEKNKSIYFKIVFFSK